MAGFVGQFDTSWSLQRMNNENKRKAKVQAAFFVMGMHVGLRDDVI